MYFKDLLRHRQTWLGVALLWVILFHLPLDLGPLRCVQLIGYGGVDICFFASGIGCFYSLCSEANILNFMKRRLKRLVPTYLVFIVVWLAYQFVAGNFRLQMALGNVLAIQNFTGHGEDFNWYISAIFLFYLLAPYFKAIVDRATPVGKAGFLVFLLACSIPFWHSHTYIITVTRLPIFYMGMLFADMCKKDMCISTGHVIGMIASFILGAAAIAAAFAWGKQYLWSYGLYWYPFILLTPPLCLAISYLSMLLEKTKITKPIVSFLCLCGDYSFEIYLVHIMLISCISTFIRIFDLSQYSHLIWCGGAVLLFVGCFMLRRVTAWISTLWTTIRSKSAKPST